MGITVLLQTIYKKTGLITFSGPDFISFGDKNAEEQYKVFEDAFIKIIEEDNWWEL